MLKKLAGGVGLVFTIAVVSTTISSAETLQSPSYRFDESVIGSGGLVQSNSNNYQASSSAGDLAVGESGSNSYQLQSGSKTSPDPALSFAITNANVNFGSFTPSSAAMTTATFSVSNYTSYGYIVQILGNPPTSNGHAISPMGATAPALSQAGIEQFGINVVANTAPVATGANPDNGQFGQGLAATNYNTPNTYRYVSGETIATAPKSSGVTNYTISYLVNVGSLTPGGQYTTSQTIVVTGTY